MNIEGNPFYDKALEVFDCKVVDGQVMFPAETIKQMLNGLALYVHINQGQLCEHSLGVAGVMINSIDNCVDSLVARHASELVPDTIPEDLL